MASQTFELPGSAYQATTSFRSWTLPTPRMLEIDAALRRDENPRYIENLTVRADSDAVVLNLADAQRGSFSQAGNLRLSDAFERNGSVTIESGGESFRYELAGQDVSEPYRINFTGDVATRFRAWRGTLPAAGPRAAMLTLDDGQAGPGPSPEPSPGPAPAHGTGFLERFRNQLIRYRGQLIRFGHGLGRAGFEIRIDGAIRTDVDRPSVSLTRSFGSNSGARFLLRGAADALVLPEFGEEVEVLDAATARVLFKGTVWTPPTRDVDGDRYLEKRVRAVGIEKRLQGILIQNAQGIDIVEQATAEAQFNALVALAAGFTGETDVGAGVLLLEDVRHDYVWPVLAALAQRNEALLRVTPQGVIQMLKTLPRSRVRRLDSSSVRTVRATVEPRRVRSRQFLRYGETVARRTINGDGATRAFLVAGTQTPVDYMADATAARALNAEAGDQGLRFRADAVAAARAGGGIDFFGGDAAAAASDLFVGATRVGAASVGLRMLTDGKLQLRAGVPMAAAARAAIALRHAGAGNPVWTSDGIAPTIERDGAAPTRDSGSDFTIPDASGGLGSFAIHGETVFRYRRLGSHNQGVYGYRRSESSLVRDSRFDGTAVTDDNTQIYFLFVLGDKLHMLRVSARRVRSWAFRINAGSLTRLTESDWDFPAVDAGSAVFAIKNLDETEVWLSNNSNSSSPFKQAMNWRGYAVQGETLTRSAARDFNASAVAGLGSIGGFWQDGDFVYYGDRPTNVGNSVLRRMSTRGVHDAGRYQLGRRTNNNNFLILGFGGRVYIGTSGDLEGFRVETEFLQWDAGAPAFDTLEARRAANSGFRAALMDPDVIGVNVPGARFEPTPQDVRSVRQITLNGTVEDLGDDADWRFDRARQKLVQSPSATALTASDALVVDYTAQGIAQACAPTASYMQDEIRTLDKSAGMTVTEARRIATLMVGRYSKIPASVEVRLASAELGFHLDVGDVVTFDSSLLRRFGVADAEDADEWVLRRIVLRTNGTAWRYTIEAQRGQVLEEWADWWRQRTAQPE